MTTPQISTDALTEISRLTALERLRFVHKNLVRAQEPRDGENAYERLGRLEGVIAAARIDIESVIKRLEGTLPPLPDGEFA